MFTAEPTLDNSFTQNIEGQKQEGKNIVVLLFLLFQKLKCEGESRCHWKTIPWFSTLCHAEIEILLAGFHNEFLLWANKNHVENLSV